MAEHAPAPPGAVASPGAVAPPGGGKTAFLKKLKHAKPPELQRVAAALLDGELLSSSHDFSSVVITLSRARCAGAALETLSKMRARELPAKVHVYNIVMKACGQSQRWDAALALLDDMKSTTVSLDGASYSAAMSACDKGGRWQQALGLLNEMREQEVTADVVSYNAAMTACAQGGCWEAALDLLGKMGAGSVDPDDLTYRVFDRAFERGEQRLRLKRIVAARARAAALRGEALPAQAAPAPPCDVHFCIIQGGEEGIDGWSLEAGSKLNRWDALLDGLLRSLMMDGQWRPGVRASAFVGRDAVHIGSDVQPLVMPAVPSRVGGERGAREGRTSYQPATLKAWEELLWRERGVDHPGLRWRAGLRGDSPRARLLENLDDMLESAPDDSAVLVFSAGGSTTYHALKDLGRSSAPKSSCVFVLMGGAHGFDGSDDDDGGAFLEQVTSQFTRRFGAGRVLRVSLGGAAAGRPTVFPLANVASFVSIEHSCGELLHAVAGLEAAAAD